MVLLKVASGTDPHSESNLQPTKWSNGQTSSATPSRTSSPRWTMSPWALQLFPGEALFLFFFSVFLHMNV